MAPSANQSETTFQRRNDESSSVQVAVRVRPMLSSESGSTQCIEVLRGTDSDATNVVRIGGESGPTFAFDEAFHGSTSQHYVYEQRVAPLVKSCMNGYNATTLAYGQTGSGKTHTMLGPSTSLALHTDLTAGVIPRAIRDLFSQLEEVRLQCSNKENQPGDDDDDDDGATFEYEVRVQFLEVYGEEIRDLLTPSSSERLTIRDIGLDGEPEVVGATKHKVESAEDALLCLSRGMMRRVTGATAMNESSSRSHAILSVLVEQTTTLEERNDDDEESHQVQHVQVKRSKFNFVDLAGSERQKRTQAEGQRLKEGIDINKGLLVLGNVISALGDPKKVGKSFVPYRDSKLTRLLKGSLGGNHKTLMIACVSPSSNNLEESLNCLRYANRAKNIQNNAVVNVDAGSRLISELRQQVQALATDYLKVKQGEESQGTFSIEVLKSLAAGSDPTAILLGSRPPCAPINPASPGTILGASNQNYAKMDTETELDRTREQLRQAKAELLTTTEALHVTKAEKELYRLQMAATSTGETTTVDLNTAFLERTVAYEKEISSLKEAVRKATIPYELGIAPRCSEDSPRALRREMNADTPSESTDSAFDSPEFSKLHSRVLQSLSHSDQLEAEEQAETAEIAKITNKFLDDDEPMIDTEERENQSFQIEELDHEAIDGSLRQTQQMEAHLLEISRGIEAKEDLINQLQLSQEKYAAMREFYEKKLQEMEEQVRERESEREQLVLELQKVEESSNCTKDLQERLKDKERHIEGLRKKQRELASLTKVSSRNESEIGRLRNDVVTMKQKKVELQKLITSERKSHAAEIQRLKKQAMQQEREATKWKRVSDRKAVEAEKAQQVAKARLDQVGQLRTKYKEAERKLRVRVMKRGVMEKAGLDPIIVGRRDSKQQRMASEGTRGQGRKGKPTKSAIDYDAVRGFLDQKIAEVGRKEGIADKLANEWEDHLELVSQRDASLQSSDTPKEAIEALDVQIQYKEERIRQLAKRLGKVEMGSSNTDQVDDAAFLMDSGLTSIIGKQSPVVAAKVAARVLFGMVVRERRRVASLARTASSLDEKAVEAEKSASAKDIAFRSYMEEERREREILAQGQQEQILSLMAMVQEQEIAATQDKEDNSLPDNAIEAFNRGKDAEEKESKLNAKLMVLANERISALQNQLHELQAECKALEAYKEKEEEAQSLLSSKEEETEELRKQLHLLRSSLRQIREAVSMQTIAEDEEEDDELSQNVLGIVMEALHPSRSEQPRKSPSLKIGSPSPRRPKSFTPRLKRHVELMHTSDSEEDGEIPEWAGDIMVDLAIIAENKIPPSLRNIDASPATTTSPGNERKTKGGSVFDRLTNPDSFTGVQKQKTTRQRRTKAKSVDNTRGGKDERRAVSRAVSESLEKVVFPEDKPRLSAPDKNGAKELFKNEALDRVSSNGKPEDSRSVFDRLISPSNYTGTQKERAQNSGRDKEIEKSADEGSDALLDELLGSDTGTAERLSFSGDDGDVAEQLHHQKVSEYTQQDVFERLQRTTTQSYAVKHSHPPIRSPMENIPVVHTAEIQVEQEETEISPTESTTVDHSEYYRQNVFERLQKTTTQAYAKKTKSGDK